MKQYIVAVMAAALIALSPTLASADAAVDGTNVTITEQVPGAANQRVTLRVFRKGMDTSALSDVSVSDMEYLGEAETDSEGNITFVFPLTASSGSYPYLVQPEAGGDAVSGMIYFVNDTDFQTAVRELGDALDLPEAQRPAAVKAVMEEHMDTFQLKMDFGVYDEIAALDHTDAYVRMARVLTKDMSLEQIRQTYQQSIVLSAVKNGSVTQTQTVLENCRPLMGCTDETAAKWYQSVKLAVSTSLTGKVFAEPADFCAAFYETTALNAINAASGWQEMGTAMRELKVIARLDTSAFDAIGDASRQNAALQKLVGRRPFSSPADFKTKLAEAIAAAGTTGGGNGGGNGSHSGGGNGNSSTVGIPQQMLDDLYQNNVGGDNTPQEKYSDLSEAEWARDAILKLTELSIVSGRGAGRFVPNDAVTREEYVKMLVLALGFDTAEPTNRFADVEANAWYAPYVEAACAAGICEGTDEGVFGVGEAITRQDAAVMAVRALEAKDRVLAGENNIVFSDEGQIAPYAREAVSRLAAAGVINGVGDGRFAPEDEVTRAQSAKMIDGIRG